MNKTDVLYQEIVHNMLEGVMVISMQGQITMLNAAAEKILGLTQDAINKPYGMLFLEDERNDSFHEMIFHTIYDRSKESNILVDYYVGDTVKNLSVTTSFLHTTDDKYVVLVMNDVTELNELKDAQIALEKIQKLNHELEAAKNEAIVANETKSRFLSNMSHEIRTPINAVLGMNEMILRECEDEQLLEYAGNIQSAGKTLLFLINDILDMSKIESGKMEIIETKYCLSDVLHDLWNMIFLKAQEKGLQITFMVEETIPNGLYGDDVRIKQIITNLLTNAVKYTPKGYVELKVGFEQGKEGIELAIAVKDSGIGIKEEDMGKLFESFQRLDEKKNRNIEGTGLGMNITMSLLKMMHGDMKVESDYGKGSTFKIMIPQKIADSQPVGKFSPQDKRGVAMKRKGQFTAPLAKILVVDDNTMNLAVVKGLLQRTKMQITTAMSGRECLELVSKEFYHVILMDHMMPEMDGIETLQAIKQLNNSPCQNTPVIALTANAVAGARELYMSSGFANFLTKPIDGELLEEMLASYLPQDMIENSDKDSTQLHQAEKRDAFFIELLQLFVKASVDRRMHMEDFRKQNDMKNYAILVHALKGDARTLKEEKLGEIAFAHEMESKEGNAQYVNEHWQELITEWDCVLQKFGEILAQENISDKQEQAKKEAIVIGKNELLSLMNLLADFESEQVIEKIKEYLNHELDCDMKDRLEQALCALEQEYDDEKASRILQEGM